MIAPSLLSTWILLPSLDWSHLDIMLTFLMPNVHRVPPHIRPSYCYQTLVLNSLAESGRIPPGSCLLGEGTEKILIVISQANDLWSIFRLEPHMTGGGGRGPFSWMWNEIFLFSPITSGTHRTAEGHAKPSFEDELIILLLTALCKRSAQLLILILSALYGKMLASDWIVC